MTSWIDPAYNGDWHLHKSAQRQYKNSEKQHAKITST